MNQDELRDVLKDALRWCRKYQQAAAKDRRWYPGLDKTVERLEAAVRKQT